MVGGLEPWNFMMFHSVGNVIIPNDEVTFFRGVGIPPTSIYRASLLGLPFIVVFPRLIGVMLVGLTSKRSENWGQ